MFCLVLNTLASRNSMSYGKLFHQTELLTPLKPNIADRCLMRPVAPHPMSDLKRACSKTSLICYYISLMKGRGTTQTLGSISVLFHSISGDYFCFRECKQEWFSQEVNIFVDLSLITLCLHALWTTKVFHWYEAVPTTLSCMAIQVCVPGHPLVGNLCL